MRVAARSEARSRLSTGGASPRSARGVPYALERTLYRAPNTLNFAKKVYVTSIQGACTVGRPHSKNDLGSRGRDKVYLVIY